MTPARAARASSLAQARAARVFDLVVIGGGATGCGVALDAAARGSRRGAARSRRLREGDQFACDQAGARRRALSSRRATCRLVREALYERSNLLAERPAPGAAAGLRDAGLPPVGGAVLRYRA
jgi:glycerol-3-phosphate dehydrogenase